MVDYALTKPEDPPTQTHRKSDEPQPRKSGRDKLKQLIEEQKTKKDQELVVVQNLLKEETRKIYYCHVSTLLDFYSTHVL